MGEKKPIDLDLLMHEVEEKLPGWKFLMAPEPFTRAPERHLRAKLARGGAVLCVILRGSRSAEAYANELFAYQRLLPEMGVKTPKLLGTFSLGVGAGWMILEDMGDRRLETESREDRCRFLREVGVLNGKGLVLLRSDPSLGARMQTYQTGVFPPSTDWIGLLRYAVEVPSLEIGRELVNLAGGVQRNLGELPQTVLHGDTDPSNAVATPEGLALVDWERVCVGPVGLDLGRIMEDVESTDELESYREGFSGATGCELPQATLHAWADLADGFNCLLWVCYYIWHWRAGKNLSDAWRRESYLPLLGRLRELRTKREDWFVEP